MTPNNPPPEPARPASRGPGRRRLEVWDFGIAVAVSGIPLIVHAVNPRGAGGDISGADIVASLIALALLLNRRRFPVPVLVLSVAGSIWSITVSETLVVLQISAIIAVYTVSSVTSRTAAWAAGAATAVTLLVASALTTGSWLTSDTLAVIAWTGMATAAGDGVRIRRAYLKAVEDRADRAERILEEEGRRRVVEERLRIARDLHDVVAHHVAVINVQAGVASHLLREDPDGASEALAHVRQGGRNVLDELSSILSVLRRPEDSDATTEPIPNLDRLDELITSFQSSGLEVEWRTAGAHRQLPAALGLTGYRIVQEALTNAHKHGDGRALLRLMYRPNELSIEVLNGGASRGDAVSHPGHGITGMHERVAAVGGELETGRTPEGRFRVHATLPVPEPEL